MLGAGVLYLIIGSTSLTPDTVLSRPDTGSQSRSQVAAQDTLPRRRPRSIEVSDWYSRRLTIHRYVSYAVIPVFAAQYAAGRHLFAQSREAPTWAKTVHRVGATATAGMFTVNTVTGVWNLWDSRSVSQNRTLRTAHALMMITADAGFTYAGAKLSNEAETSLDARKKHRLIALTSMGVTVASGLMMKIWNR